MTLVVSASAGTDISVGSVMSLCASFCCMLIAGFGVSSVSSADEFAMPMIVGLLGALLMGGFYGGLGGAIGMTIGDLLDPVYVIYAPKTLICKLCIGLIAGAVGHGIFKISRMHAAEDKKRILRAAAAASACALGFNVIADPLLGYYYKILIIGKPAAEVALAWNIASTSINAVVSAVVSTALYLPLRTALRRCGMGAAIR